MTRFDGFVGPSYPSWSIYADCQRSVNLYREIIESGKGKSPSVLYGTPGHSLFCTLPALASRALFTIKQLTPLTDRVFAINADKFYELFTDGSYVERGTVIDDGRPASIAENPTQLFIASGQSGYVYNKATHAFTGPIADVTPGGVVFLDGFFVAFRAGSQDFNISDLNDGLVWDPIDIGTASGSPDNIVSELADHRELWLFGSSTIQIFYNSGNADFPFENVPGGLIEQGAIAAGSPVKLDNSVFWVGGDVRGGAMVFRADGFRPSRVSNHAVENAMRLMTHVDTAWAYGYQENGHSFYVLTFPDDNQTWVYDVTTDEWHERLLWLPSEARYVANRPRTHTYGFNKHLVGDRTTGDIYESSVDIFADYTLPMRRQRTAPHLSDQMKWTANMSLTIDVMPGQGLTTGQGSDPMMSLRWSNDGGQTWSNERTVAVGKIGEYKRRAIFSRLGRSRDRVYDAVMTDPIKWAITDAYFDSGPGQRG